MTQVVSMAGRFDMAALEALCVDNAVPTVGEIAEAKARMSGLLLAATELLYRYPVATGVNGKYVREQDAFAPIRRMMERSGWTFCGAGYYSAAFFKSGLVIKVGFKAEDSGLMYATWCRANQGRAGVPVVYSLQSSGVCFMVLMDRLEAIAGELEQGSPTFDQQLAAEFDSVRETINQGVDGWGTHMDLCRTALDIRNFFVGVANFDVHTANVMLDRSGNLIITDPIAFAGDTLSGSSTYAPSYAAAA